jgi:DNA-binding response OmpR family regulator
MPPKKILVVDDAPADRKLMEHFLTGNGFEVRVAENGRLGLATLETFKPDLVLLDMHMPELDGAGTLREVARRWPTLPVIMVTVNEDVETTSRLLQLGAADYVPKPFDLDYLEQAIGIQLSAARG